MEQGSSFRVAVPKYPTADPNYRILAHQRSRFTHYYFYIRDEVLGPLVMRVASFFPFQTTYYLVQAAIAIDDHHINHSVLGANQAIPQHEQTRTTEPHSTPMRAESSGAPDRMFLALRSASARWMASAARTARSTSFSCACG